MAVHQTRFLHVRVGEVVLHLRSGSSTHREVLLVCGKDRVPQVVFVLETIMHQVFGRAAAQWVQGLIRSSGLDPLVTSEHFGPRLFQNQNPDLIVVRSAAECPLVLADIKGKAIVYNDSVFLAAEVQLYSVNACLVCVVLAKNIFDSLGVLGKRRQS